MGTELMNTAGFADGPAAAFAGHKTDERLSDGVGGGYPMIRYGGKTWSIDYHGQNYVFTNAEGYQSPYIDVVILRQARNKSKAYFPTYTEGSKDPPVCTSMDGIVPDQDVEDKQSDTCGSCPHNKMKKNEKGQWFKACSDSKRLAVIPMPTQTAKVIGEPIVEPTFLRIPAGSLQNLGRMGDEALQKGYEYYMFWTRIDFDPKENFRMRFVGHQGLKEAEAQVVLKLREDPQSYRIVSGELGGAMKTIEAPEETVRLAPPQDTGLVQGHRETIVVDEKAELAAKLEADRKARQAAVRAQAAEEEAAAAAAKAKVTAQQPKTLELKAEVVDTGLGGKVAAPAAPQTVQSAAVDTGEPDQADALLDAAIAQFMPKS